jgi:hypothetical protein
MQEWFKKTYESVVDQMSKAAEKIQKSVEEYAFDESKKKEYKEGLGSIGDGFQQVFKGFTVLATSTAKTVSEWLVPKGEKEEPKKPSAASKKPTDGEAGKK